MGVKTPIFGYIYRFPLDDSKTVLRFWYSLCLFILDWSEIRRMLAKELVFLLLLQGPWTVACKGLLVLQSGKWSVVRLRPAYNVGFLWWLFRSLLGFGHEIIRYPDDSQLTSWLILQTFRLSAASGGWEKRTFARLRRQQWPKGLGSFEINHCELWGLYLCGYIT